MKRRIEKIFVIYLFHSIIYLFLTGLYFQRNNPTLFKSDIITLYSVIIICLFLETFTQKTLIFIFTSLIHFLLLMILFMDIGFGEPSVNIFHIILYCFILSLKLPLIYSLMTCFFTLLLSSVIAHMGNSCPIPLGLFFFYGIMGILFIQLVAYYREELVVASRRNREHNKSLAKLESVSEALLQHMVEIKEESAEEERLRITRELHDSLGYSMTNIVMIMNAARYLTSRDLENFKDYCEKAKKLASSTMEETRITLYKLREISKDIPKNPAIFFDRMCRDFQDATGIITECHGGNFSTPLSERTFHTIYRAIQVGFINALKHGETKNIRLFLWKDQSEMRITIWNNRSNQNNQIYGQEEGIGLKGIRERLNLLGGELSLEHNKDGFSLLISIPITIKESDFNSEEFYGSYKSTYRR